MKPYVILNSAASLDGVIGGGKKIMLSNEEDWRRVHKLRASVDAVMVGVNTVLADDPLLTVRHVRGKTPRRVVVDSMARTPPSALILGEDKKATVAVSERAPEKKIMKLKNKADVVVSGKEKVDLPKLLDKLYSMGVERILLEGGGRLNKSMLEEGLVDEIFLTITPHVIGEGTHFVEGRLNRRLGLVLLDSKRVGDQIILHYKVEC